MQASYISVQTEVSFSHYLNALMEIDNSQDGYTSSIYHISHTLPPSNHSFILLSICTLGVSMEEIVICYSVNDKLTD